MIYFLNIEYRNKRLVYSVVLLYSGLDNETSYWDKKQSYGPSNRLEIDFAVIRMQTKYFSNLFDIDPIWRLQNNTNCHMDVVAFSDYNYLNYFIFVNLQITQNSDFNIFTEPKLAIYFLTKFKEIILYQIWNFIVYLCVSYGHSKSIKIQIKASFEHRK